MFRHASMAPRCPVITVDPDKGCLTISSFDSLVSKALNLPVFLGHLLGSQTHLDLGNILALLAFEL